LRGAGLRCARCKQVSYCCKEHQLAHWRLSHKHICMPCESPEEPQATTPIEDALTFLRGQIGDESEAEVCEAVMAIRREINTDAGVAACSPVKLEAIVGILVRTMALWAHCGPSREIKQWPALNVRGWSTFVSVMCSAPPRQRLKLREVAHKAGALQLLLRVLEQPKDTLDAQGHILAEAVSAVASIYIRPWGEEFDTPPDPEAPRFDFGFDTKTKARLEEAFAAGLLPLVASAMRAGDLMSNRVQLGGIQVLGAFADLAAYAYQSEEEFATQYDAVATALFKSGAVLLVTAAMRAHITTCPPLVSYGACTVTSCLLAEPSTRALMNDLGQIHDGRWELLQQAGFPEALRDAIKLYPPSHSEGGRLRGAHTSLRGMHDSDAERVRTRAGPPYLSIVPPLLALAI
tara:strand:- start:332 stop:1543 length:1212 start_codon:yes stop_codon:yes gene_type:complete